MLEYTCGIVKQVKSLKRFMGVIPVSFLFPELEIFNKVSETSVEVFSKDEC